ncbi:MAG: ZIP family metal transporter [Candidatus Aenigmatarchaeota archaeon]|nr:MAG: ZIP family metal transporter [Candidatus Aenigmarchaeota archaeon]
MELSYTILIIIISILGPVIGSVLGFIKRPSDFFMYNMLAFAAGVMLAVSFLELIPESIGISSVWLCFIGIIIGSIVMYGLDKLIPHIHPELCRQEQGRRLEKTAIYLLLGIFLHNFPEGMAMGIGVVTELKLGLLVALAIAIHNIPEGVCTSAPYYYVTKKRLRSFLISSSTAIPTIIGFLFAHFLFQNISMAIAGIIIAATAGIRIYISADELIPTSCSRRDARWSHSTIFSLIVGVLSVIVLGSF